MFYEQNSIGFVTFAQASAPHPGWILKISRNARGRARHSIALWPLLVECCSVGKVRHLPPVLRPRLVRYPRRVLYKPPAGKRSRCTLSVWRLSNPSLRLRTKAPSPLTKPLRIFWPIAHSAVDLLTSEDIDRVGQCGDDRGCGWLFFDTNRNHSRRWCRMEDCGNRAKAHRHYHRQSKNKKD